MVSAHASGLSGQGSSPGDGFSKAPETFQARKAIFSSSVSTRQKCIRMKLLV